MNSKGLRIRRFGVEVVERGVAGEEREVVPGRERPARDRAHAGRGRAREGPDQRRRHDVYRSSTSASSACFTGSSSMVSSTSAAKA